MAVYYDENGNSVQDPDEPSSQHFVNWITSITSSGPITAINLGPDMACQARYQGDSEGEFYGGTPGSCGVHLAVDGTVWGSQSSDFQQVSQTSVTGGGTSGYPIASSRWAVRATPPPVTRTPRRSSPRP